MKIIRFVAENLKRLKLVEIEPKGNIVEISGPNGSGKTSVLEALWWTLAGTREMQKQPIRVGATEGRTELDLGDIIVRRKFSQTGSTLVVERKSDGVRLKTPQEVLDKLYSKVALDPLAFSRMKSKDQFEQLRKMVPLEVDVDKLDEANASDFSKRTDLNREIKSMQSRAASLVFPPNLPAEKIDISALSAEVEKSATHNKDREIESARRADIARQVKSLRDKADHDDQSILNEQARIAEIQKRIDFHKSEAASRRKAADDLQNELDRKQPIPDAIDVSDFRKKIDDAIAANGMIVRREDHKTLLGQLAEKQKAADELTEAIETRQKQKSAAIAAAKFPVGSLGFGKDEVLLNGIPLEQASTAEQLRVGCAIAMAMNPELRYIAIRDGSLLDSKSMDVIRDLAKSNDFTVFIETVDETGTVGIALSEGEVVADNQKPDEQTV